MHWNRYAHRYLCEPCKVTSCIEKIEPWLEPLRTITMWIVFSICVNPSQVPKLWSILLRLGPDVPWCEKCFPKSKQTQHNKHYLSRDILEACSQIAEHGIHDAQAWRRFEWRVAMLNPSWVVDCRCALVLFDVCAMARPCSYLASLPGRTHQSQGLAQAQMLTRMATRSQDKHIVSTRSMFAHLFAKRNLFVFISWCDIDMGGWVVWVEERGTPPSILY